MRLRLLPRGGAPLLIDGTRIAPEDGRPADVTLELGEGVLRPGLVNAHDHLHRNHFPRLGAPPYSDAYAWGEDLHARFAPEIVRARQISRETAFLFGALKSLVAGATTVVHHDAWDPFLGGGFPVRVPRLRVAHSLLLEKDLAAAVRGVPETAGSPLTLHLAEGTTPGIAGEVREAARLGLLDERLLAVHGVGVDGDGIGRLERARTALVWCPTSNTFLFGTSAPADLLSSGIDVLLGSDSLLTGAGTLLDEMRAARATGLLSDTRLGDAVGAAAARRLGLDEPSLAPGAVADLVFFRRPPLEATARDVALVLVGGAPRLSDERFGEVFERAGVPSEPLVAGGTEKRVVAPLGRVAAEVVRHEASCGRILA